MKIKMTKQMRVAFLEMALRDAFHARFEKLQERVNEWAKQKIQTEHPAFAQALKNKNLRPYLSVSSGACVSLRCDGDIVPMRCPAWGVDWTLVSADGFAERYPESKHRGVSCFARIYAHVDYCPSSHPSFVFLAEDPLAEEYMKLWREFSEALNTLTSAIQAYSERSLFEKDFPLLAKYLPANATARQAGTALMVPVADISAKLATLGIPA